MKRIIFLIASFSLLIIGNSCAENVIVNPEFDNSNASEFLQFSKIELTDTATIVYADVYNRPNNWVKFPSGSTLRGSNGKIYKLIGCDGFELDKEVFMPESGTVSFTVYFEPVDKKEKTVDYYESDDENAWRMEGIKLYNVKHTEPVQCLLKGEVINRPQSSRLALLKAGEDFRTAKVIYIPIRDGKFEYTLYAQAEEAYQLIFYDEMMAAAWRPIDFITETGTFYFSLNSMDEWLNNSIKGGKYTEAYQSIAKKLNEEIMPLYQALNEKHEALMNEGKFYTSEANGILEQASALSNDDPQKNNLYEQFYKMQREGTDLTAEAAALQQESMRTQIIFVDKQLEYAKANPDITGYTLLVENIRTAVEQNRFVQLDVAPMFSIFHDIYEKKYPKHPYTSLINTYMQAAAIKTGKPYPDVAAADVNGREVNLSELIKGKVALIHLWASWCGPCRRHGMEMIPVYEKYKDKGFTVVGIAREQKKEPMFAAVKRDKYPWINLLELNDKNAIWTKFGVGNAGGGEFLVDAEGNFLAVNASPEEMKYILQNLFDKE